MKSSNSSTSETSLKGKESSSTINSETSDVYDVEKILDKRVHKNGTIKYFIKWKNFEDKHNSWEPSDNMKCPTIVAQFEAEYQERKLREEKEKLLARTSTSAAKRSRFHSVQNTENKENIKTEAKKMRTTFNSRSSLDSSSRVLQNTVNQRVKAEKAQNEPNESKSLEAEDVLSIGFLDKISKGKKPEKIFGGLKAGHELVFLVKWVDIEQCDLIPLSYYRKKFPEQLLDYCCENFSFKD